MVTTCQACFRLTSELADFVEYFGVRSPDSPVEYLDLIFAELLWFKPRKPGAVVHRPQGFGLVVAIRSAQERRKALLAGGVENDAMDAL